MIRVLVSACLLGERVRYTGADAKTESPILARWLAEKRIVPFCPEVAGGLAVPRPPAEIRGGDGRAVWLGAASVAIQSGQDITAAFCRGARCALECAESEGVRLAVLKDDSPSCGSTSIYDGSFSGRKTAGQGVTAALLQAHGIRVFSDSALPQAERYLAELECRTFVLDDPPSDR
jgi:uncharacterized protein YbbK (DUF523 family)